MTDDVTVGVVVNGRAVERTVPSRLTLVDFLRHELALHGTHVGCEQGVCGMCTVLLDGEPVKACLLLAAQADGADITTVESLNQGEELHPLQRAFRDTHALQCGYCTPGFLMTTLALAERPDPPRGDELREELAGVLCRCTGYQNIVKAVEAYLGLSGSASGEGADRG
jgi:aerobic-type carbon monoxide dehydrogenase small subunit (CoxS/CutS family)